MARLFDVTASLAALVVLAPLFAIVAIAIKLSSTGPVLYRASRIGRGGVPFTMYKFRTMHHGTAGPSITRRDDPPVLTIGRALRRYKVDELPQLFNIIRGDMNLVGPRPEDEEYVRMYTEEERGVLTARPGLTSPASLVYRDEEALLTGDGWHDRYVNEIMRTKLRVELDYLRRRSFACDLGVLARTAGRLLFGAVFRRSGSPADGETP